MENNPETPTPSSAPAASPASLQQAAVVAAPVEELIDIEHFAKIKLRVARIEAVEAVPKSNKLLKLQLDLGPLGKRQILSGIAKQYTPESLLGRKIVVIANLKPATLMGQQSQGMLLAASSDDGTMLCVLDPGQNLPEGSVVR